jgi:hypothetical protein
MHHHLIRLHTSFFANWRHLWSPELVALFLALFVFVLPAGASTRLEERSLLVQNNEPGATTSYRVSFKYMTPTPINSVDMLFCMSPIPYEACVPPPGLNVSGAVLSDQQGESGYSISTKTTNHIILSRASNSLPTTALSSYNFENIKNPTASAQAFSVRLRTHTSSDATGTQVDFGSVRAQVNQGIVIQTQVPPMLVFCLAQQVDYGCTKTNDTFYTDMGELNSESTLTAKSQMAVGTNASGGFAITAVGIPFSAGTNVIDSPLVPTESKPGTNQFGINLVENTAPNVGNNPEGEYANAIASSDYNQQNKYKYVSGDVVAYSPNVSLMKKFTVSYILNSSPTLHAGVYSTTLTYIASGRF